jgi:hypothetical protein
VIHAMSNLNDLRAKPANDVAIKAYGGGNLLRS